MRKYYNMSTFDAEPSSDDVAKDMDVIWSKLFDVMHLSCQFSSSKGEFSHIGPNIVNPKCNDLAMGVFNDASSTIDLNLQRVQNSLSLLQNRREMYLKSSVNRLESILISKAKTLGECQTHVITRKERLRTQNITSEDRLRDLILEVYGEYGKSAIRCIRRGDYVENMSLLNMIWLVYKLRWERFMLRLYKDALDDGDHNRGSVQHTIMCPKAHSDEFNQLSFRSRKFALGLLNNSGEGVSKGGGHGGGGVIPESIQVLSIIRIYKGSSSASSTENFPKQPKLFENRMSLGSLVEYIRQIMPTNSKARVGSANASTHGDEGGSSSSGKSAGHGGPGLRRPRERVDRDKDGGGVSDSMSAEGGSSSTSITPKSRLGKLCRYLKSMSIDWMQPTSLHSFYKLQYNNTSSSLNSSRKAESEVVAAENTGISKPKSSTENSGIISGLFNSLVGTGGSGSSSSNSSSSSSKSKSTSTSLNSNIAIQTSSGGASDAANSTKGCLLTNLVETGNISPIFSPSTGSQNVVSMPHLESLEKLTKKQFIQTYIAWDRIYFCIEERFFALRCNSLSSSKSPSGSLSEEDCEGYTMMAYLEVIQSEVLSKLPSNSETSYNLSQLSFIRETLNRLHNMDDRSKIEVLPFKKLNVSKDNIKSHLPSSLSAEALDVAASKILLLLKGCPDIVRINIGGMNLHFSSACVANLAELRNSFIGTGAESTSIHGFPRAQFMNQCPHPWLSLLITPETFLLDSLYIVSTCLSPPSASSSVSSTDRSSPQPDGALYTLVPLHDICTHELTKHALCLDNSSNSARSTLANVNSSCNLQHLNNFTLLVPDSARSRLTVGSNSSDAASSSSLLSLNEKSLATGDVDKFLSNDLFHKYMIFTDEFTNFKKPTGEGASAKAIVHKCLYLVQIFVNRDGASPDINPTDHGCLVDNHILRTAIALRNYQSVVLGSAKLSSLAGSDSVRKLANLSEVEQKENFSKQDYTSSGSSSNNNNNSSSSSSLTSSSSNGSKEKDWDRSVMSTICRWRSCICESVLVKSDNAISSHQMPPLCYFHFQLKAFMDSSSDRVYGDSSNFLPKRAPNIPKHITVDALAKFEIITKNVISEGRPFNIITSQHGNAISDSIAPALDNSDEHGGEREGSGSQDTRRETSAAANRVGWRGVGARSQVAGGVAPLSLSKHNLSKTLSERSRDMYIIRAASSLLQELWDGKLKGTLQVFIKKVISEFSMKARLEAKLNSYKNAMIFYTNRVARITHHYEAKLLMITQSKESSPGKVRFANKGTVPVGPVTKVSPRGKKTVLFQNQSLTNIGLSSTYNTSQSATKYRASLPPAPKWAVWKMPKRAATVVEMQMELERDYMELLKKEQCVSLEMRQFLMYKLYPTTEVNVIRKEQKLLKEAIEFKVENQEILPLSHLTQHQGGGGIGKDKDDGGGQVDASRRDEAAGSPGRDNPLASSQLLSNLSYYQSMKLLASMESGFTEKKLFILAQKRSECDEMHERSALQQQKMLQALNKDKNTKDAKPAGAHGSKSVDKSGNRPDPAAFSMQSRF